MRSDESSTFLLAEEEEDVRMLVVPIAPDQDLMDPEAVRPLHAGSTVTVIHATRSNPTRDVVMGLDLEDQDLGMIADTPGTIARLGMDLHAGHHPLRILEPIAHRADLVSPPRHPRILRHLDYLLDPNHRL
jgi:hypothetical protein